MAWANKSFGDCAELVKDVIQPGNAQGMPYIGLEHISQGQLILLGVGKSEDVVSAKFRFNKGDILFGKLRPYFRKVIIAPFDGVCSTDIWVVRAKPSTNQRYLFYWMASDEFVDTSSRASEGTKMPRARWDYVEQIRQYIPDEPEQSLIADVLGALDDKIELNRRMNTTLEAMARALFKSWFVDFDPIRVKVEGRQPYGMDSKSAALIPDGFEVSPMGEIPKGWKVITLDGIAKYLNGLALQKFPPKCDDYLPVIKIAQLRKNSTEDADKASTNLDPDYIVDDGDVLFSWSGSLEVVIWCGGKGALNQHLFKVTSDIYPKWFYYLWTKHHLADFQQIAAGKATTMGHIQRYHLKQALTLVPPKRILHWMTEQISPMIDLYIKNAVQSRNLAAMRDALLPRLMSGEVRVKDSI